MLIRSLLAILVVLPPGTFRSLHALTCRSEARSATEAAPSPQSIHGTEEEVLACTLRGLAPVRPKAPLRFRAWSDVTFVTKDAPSVAGDTAEKVAAPSLPPEVCGNSSRCRLSGRALSPLHAHRSSRTVLIATCVHQV